MAVEVRIPPLGESVTEGVIAQWLKQDGDLVAQDDLLLELETDKAAMELPAERAGILRIVKQAGETVQVGDLIATLEPSEGRVAPEAGSKPEPEAAASAPPVSPLGESSPAATRAPETTTSRPLGPLSPAVRNLIDEHQLDPATITATGKGGRLTKADVLAHLEAGGGSAPRVEPPTAPPTITSAPRDAAAPVPEADEEIVPMTLMRKRIAERLVQAQHTAAILTTFNEIDMTAVMTLRSAQKERFKERHGVPLGFMSFFARACIAALRDVRAINAEIREEAIVYRRDVHLGVAVGTPRGLVVPVVRHADRMNFAEIEAEIGRLARLARDKKLSIGDLSGGTFTISNGGVYGSLLSTPILNPPQSGILGMHKIEKRPIVVDDQIVIRPMMYVALSYDHRIVDGEQAVTFLVRVKERLEDPARLLLEV